MNIGGKTTNPGELRTQITFLSRATTGDAGGFQVPTLTEVATVWSKWTNVHGSEAWMAASMTAEQAATVLVRWIANLDPTWLVRKGTDLYEIVSPDNIGERGEYIELKVKRWKPG